MRIRKWTVVVLFATTICWYAGPVIADTLDEAREKFIQAYNDMDYAALCDVLQKDASFRGSVFPEKWTHTRDKIITERWRSSRTCTEIAKRGQNPKPLVNTLSVGSSTITLTPDKNAVTPAGPHYILESGIFEMKPKLGSKAKLLSGPYVILWTQQGKDWQMKHIDMHP